MTREPIDNLLCDLSKIKDGWLFADSLGPTPAVLRDLTEATPLLASIGGYPTAEIDDGDGSVTIIWEPEDRVGCIAFNGNRRAIALACDSVATLDLSAPIKTTEPLLMMLRAAVERGVPEPAQRRALGDSEA